MLPHSLIYGSIAVGLLVASGLVGTDSKQLSGMTRLFTGKDALARFQRVYLPGFLTAMLADWLQGPFVYALYNGYGMDREYNGYLFVAGFGASGIFGTFVGSAADWCGRRRFALLYCVIYFGHCLTKHVNRFPVLLFGRVLGGISTSLLFSVFDSWLVSESQRQGFSGEQLGSTFSLAYFGSSIAAIVAGQLGEAAARLVKLTPVGGGVHYGGYVTPFDLSNVILVLCMLIIMRNWSENYGQSKADTAGNLVSGLSIVLTQKRVLLCGLIASSFESSMFIFVFNWTPCLTEENQPAIPHGHIFSAFMIMCLLGTRIFACLAGVMSIQIMSVMIMVVSALCHMVVFLSSDVAVRYLAFLAFEVCVGLYFPMMGTLKGDIVPEERRSTIYNIYRLPLNVVVLLPLLMNFSIVTTFTMTAAILSGAAVCSIVLTGAANNAYKDVPGDEPGKGVAATEIGLPDTS